MEWILTFFSFSSISLMGQCAAVTQRFWEQAKGKGMSCHNDNKYRKLFVAKINFGKPSDHFLNSHQSYLQLLPSLHQGPVLL